MAILSTNATLNGVDDFTIYGETFSWSLNYVGTVRPWGGAGPDIQNVNLTFSGDWEVSFMEFEGDFAKSTIIDTNDGGERFIGFLRLGGQGGNITLNTTTVDIIRARGNGNDIVNLGSAGPIRSGWEKATMLSMAAAVS